MKLSTKLTLLALLAATAGAAQADTAETKGGLKIKTDDGRFEVNVGGRIHLDANIVEEDKGAAFGSGVPTNSADSSVFFRRIRLNVSGKAYGWEYIVAPNFAQSTSGDVPGQTNTANGQTTGNTNGSNAVGNSAISFEEAYIAKSLNVFKNLDPAISDKLIIGQFKPFRSLEELTSSNEITMMERPITSASGIYAGRQYQIGAGYQVSGAHWNVGAGGYNLRSDASRATEGIGYSARAVYAPIIDTRTVLHLAVSGGQENTANNQSYTDTYQYYGRRGVSGTLGPANNGTTAAVTKIDNIGAEVAGLFGPFYYAGEYGHARSNRDNPTTGAGLNGDARSEAYSATLSYNIFGEVKPYDIKAGVFKNIKPKYDFGALELTARLDYGRNRTSTTATGAAATDLARIREYIFGFNYYFNPNVRAMFNYIHGEADRFNGQKDRPRTYAARLQFAF